MRRHRLASMLSVVVLALALASALAGGCTASLTRGTPGGDAGAADAPKPPPGDAAAGVLKLLAT